MNKKVIIIIGIVIVLIVGGIIGYNILNKNNSVGFDTKIQNENDKPGTTTLDSSKVLVLYFSESGNTQKLAKTIYDQVGGDFRRLAPLRPYPSKYSELKKVAKEEQDNNQFPDYRDLDIDIDDYEYIFVGYPIWYGKMPQMLYTFFNEYELNGKTIIPFLTHGGSGESGTKGVIQTLEPNANVLQFLAVKDSDMKKDQTTNVKVWLKNLGFDSKEK